METAACASMSTVPCVEAIETPAVPSKVAVPPADTVASETDLMLTSPDCDSIRTSAVAFMLMLPDCATKSMLPLLVKPTPEVPLSSISPSSDTIVMSFAELTETSFWQLDPSPSQTPQASVNCPCGHIGASLMHEVPSPPHCPQRS